MKLAAIDIGSNAVRLYIARPLDERAPDTEFKSVDFTRLPLRLGDDVFKYNEIGKKKSDLLLKALQAFQLLMEIYNVDFVRACATSAMRDASNAKKLIKEVKKATGISIDVLSGKQESKLIQCGVLQYADVRKDYLHIDVGGGSTEIAFIHAGKVKKFESFNIGTVRLREGKVKADERRRMSDWLAHVPWSSETNRHAIGTGGNMIKLAQLSGVSPLEPLKLLVLQKTVRNLQELSHQERVYDLKMNPDRAEVVDHAGLIYAEIMSLSGVSDILAPNIGLKDGIIRELWTHQLKAKPAPVG